MRSVVANVVLWACVIVVGLEIGAGIFEARTWVPLWASAPPESIIAFVQTKAVNPTLFTDAGGRFWIYSTPLVGIIALLTLATSFWTSGEHKRWRLFGSSLIVGIVILTFVWFAPTIIKLTTEAGLHQFKSREEIESTTSWWITLNWLRVVWYIGGLMALLKAFKTDPNGIAGSSENPT